MSLKHLVCVRFRPISLEWQNIEWDIFIAGRYEDTLKRTDRRETCRDTADLVKKEETWNRTITLSATINSLWFPMCIPSLTWTPPGSEQHKTFSVVLWNSRQLRQCWWICVSSQRNRRRERERERKRFPVLQVHPVCPEWVWVSPSVQCHIPSRCIPTLLEAESWRGAFASSLWPLLLSVVQCCKHDQPVT